MGTSRVIGRKEGETMVKHAARNVFLIRIDLRLLLVWMVASTAAAAPPDLPAVTAPPKELGLDPFYTKYLSAHGLPVVGSSKVSDYALREAAYLADQMLAHRPEVRDAMIRNKVRLAVMAYSERTTDIPEHRDLQPKLYWNIRARLGASRRRPAVSCAEENLLNYKGDPYSTENIMIHEFAHAIHSMGLRMIDPTFDTRLKKVYEDAKAKGLWKNTYAISNVGEYWAEGVQSWFDTNRQNDSSHNHVDTRAELKSYDPARVAKLVEEVFGDGPWRYVRPDKRTDWRRVISRALNPQGPEVPVGARAAGGPPQEQREGQLPRPRSEMAPRPEGKE